MKISVITPSIRENSLELVRKSLKLQTFKEFEWLVCSPFYYDSCDHWIQQLSKNNEDFWTYNKALNQLFRECQGELIVSINDSEWVKEDALERFWEHYVTDSQSCVAGIGDGYTLVEKGKGFSLTWQDARRKRYSEYRYTTEIDYDFSCASVPKKAIFEVGGIDEIFDRVCCFGEREMMYRIMKVGYRLFLDPKIEVLGQNHTKEYAPGNSWDIHFLEGEKMYNDIIKDVDSGKRLRL